MMKLVSLKHAFILCLLLALLALLLLALPRHAKAQADNELVSFPSAEVEFIAGPQLRSGSNQNPYPFFDQNAIAKGLEFGQNFPAAGAPIADANVFFNQNYYDQALVQYINYYRTGDIRFLEYARKVADSWWAGPFVQNGTITDFDTYSASPRGIQLSGLMLRALDGRPEMWPFITAYTRHEFQNWVGARVTYPSLYYGVRDGGYMLLYAAELGKVHPDEAVRQEFKDLAISAAVNYYARLQYADGSWRWQDDFNYNGINTVSDDGLGEEPFMIGLLLDGMIATHRLIEADTQQAPNAEKIKAAILRAVDHLYRDAYRKDELVVGMNADLPQNIRWRGLWYALIYDPTTGAVTNRTGRNTIDGGWDTNGIREVRQLNATIVFAFGYAYKLTGDALYITEGDELFDATFGKSDATFGYGLADYLEKQYNQSYRTGGRYLAWRQGGAASPVTPVPAPTPEPEPTPVTATALSLSPNYLSIREGETQQFSVTSSLDAECVSGDESVAVVEAQTCRVTGVSRGVTVVYARFKSFPGVRSEASVVEVRGQDVYATP